VGRAPILGICLGHQCIGHVYGGRIVRAPALFHGKTSDIHHDEAGVLHGLPNPFPATRYHSLVVDRESVPADLEVTAWTNDDLVMGLRHRAGGGRGDIDIEVEGVQFHPESILTRFGRRMLATWLERAGHRAPATVVAKEAGG
jgi:anthranilate synthase/aminodeoxychorismate synthase-like glutamine amidotransferase